MAATPVSAYQLLPSLSDDEYQALKADIAKRGVMVPVERDEDGAILDGHHRQRIADELGITAPTVTRAGLSEADKREHVLKLNLLRRQLGPIAWAAAYRRLASERGVELQRHGRRDWRVLPNRVTVSQIANELGVSVRTAQRRVRLADTLAEHPDLADQVDAGELDQRRAERIVRDRAAEAQRAMVETLRRTSPPVGEGQRAVHRESLWCSPRQQVLIAARAIAHGPDPRGRENRHWRPHEFDASPIGLRMSNLTTVEDERLGPAIEEAKAIRDRFVRELETRERELRAWIAAERQAIAAPLYRVANELPDEPTSYVGQRAVFEDGTTATRADVAYLTGTLQRREIAPCPEPQQRGRYETGDPGGASNPSHPRRVAPAASFPRERSGVARCCGNRGVT